MAEHLSGDFEDAGFLGAGDFGVADEEEEEGEGNEPREED
jgi:hypothetical protein